MSVDFKDILYEKKDQVARITINRPDKMNAFTARTLDEMIDAFHDAARDRTVGVVVLTGAGERAFCAGGDVSWEEGGGIQGTFDRFPDVHNAIRHCLKPVIARVNGYAIGGGHHLAYFCDLTVAAEHAVFGQNGPRVGSPADGHLVSYLVWVVGAKRAREIWYTCRRYPAAKALEWGLANAVVPMKDLDGEVDRWCEEILDKSPTCLKILKASFERDFDRFRDHPFDLQRMIAPDYFDTDEPKEGMRAFLEKRQPDFRKFRR
jgi:dihydroxynaphthoic acid synthetase